MKSIKERPIEPNYFETDREEQWYKVGCYDGATEQKGIDDAERDTAVYNLLQLMLDGEKKLWIDKACEWLMEHISGNVECNSDREPLAESFIEERKLAMQIVDDFRKAMEE